MSLVSSPAEPIGIDAERSSALTIGVLHFFAIASARLLLWDAEGFDRRAVVVWMAIEGCNGLLSLAAFFMLKRGRTDQFVRLSFVEGLTAAAAFGALPWLGTDVASTTPSKYVLLLGLVAASSISAANSSHITRRRPVFNRLIVIVGTSYLVAFVVAAEWGFVLLTTLWCIAITVSTRVAYEGNVELLALRKASEQTARHDDLTGLLSRAAFFETLDQAAAGTAPGQTDTALILFDLDGFKAINDGFGHPAGDAVLCAVAERLAKWLPDGSTLGRLGGDEFAAIVPTAQYDIELTIQQSLASIGDPVPVASGDVYVAASAGWTPVYRNEQSADLMAQADAAMYQSKNSETSTTTGFDQQLRADLDQALELRHRFRTALRRNEIGFWAQPLVHSRTRAPIAVEVLARWPHRSGAIVAPEDFARVAGETGLAVELDRQALTAAAKLLEGWSHDAELSSIVVKVNVSPVHLHNNALVRSVDELIPTRLRDRLGLEFVESRLISSADRNHDQLRSLRDMGITLSIDDFGVGYSSLTYLRRLPVSEIKIDRSFIVDLDHDVINQGLVRAIVAIASTLGLPTVAEGVETAEQFDAASSLGVSSVQGYFVGRPTPFDEVAGALRTLFACAIDGGNPTSDS